MRKVGDEVTVVERGGDRESIARCRITEAENEDYTVVVETVLKDDCPLTEGDEMLVMEGDIL